MSTPDVSSTKSPLTDMLYSDVHAQAKEIRSSSLNDPTEIPSQFENSKGDEYMISAAARFLSSEAFRESQELGKRMEEGMNAGIRAGVKDYLEKNPTSFSGTTERGTTFTLNLETPEDMLSIGYYSMTFTTTDGTTQKFDLRNGAGFRELEDGTILQFGTTKLSDEEQKALGTSSKNALEGTEGQDILVADNISSSIRYVDGKGGNDIIISLGGPLDMTLNGGDGDDQIFVAGKSTFMTPSIRSTVNIHGGDGDDTIVYQSYIEKGTISGDAGDDTILISGNVYHDATVDGGTGNDRIVQKNGTTIMEGTMSGGSGNDSLSIEGDNISAIGTIRGGDGDDSISLTAKEKLSAYSIDGGDGNDKITLTGDTVELFNSLDGGDGDDKISVTANKITASYLRLTGGKGNDQIQLNAKLVEILDSIIDGGKGDDNISISGTKVDIKNSTVTGGDGKNTIILKADHLNVKNSSIDKDSFVSSNNLTVKNSNMFGQFMQDEKMSVDTIKDNVLKFASDISKLDNADEMLSDLVTVLEKNKDKDITLIANSLSSFSNKLSDTLKNQSGQKVNAYA